MAKICPILSAENRQECLEGACMMFVEHSGGSGCGLVYESARVGNKINTLSAQVQEIQVALIKLTGA